MRQSAMTLDETIEELNRYAACSSRGWFSAKTPTGETVAIAPALYDEHQNMLQPLIALKHSEAIGLVRACRRKYEPRKPSPVTYLKDWIMRRSNRGEPT